MENDLSDPKRYTLKKIADMTTVKSGLFDHYVDYWWPVTPDEELIFSHGRSPQCNPDKRIVARLLRMYPTCTARKIPVVFIPIDPSDYC